VTGLAGARVHLAPVAPEDAAALRAIHADPAVAQWWDLPDDDFPLADEPEATRYTIRHRGEIAGMIQYGEELEPKYRHASVDLFVAPAHQRQGVASEAIGLVVEHLIATLGHHRITIDPAAANTAAVGCYTRAGFRPVGIMRRAERDADGQGWHDTLLMELVVEG
jgi:RimJ/RimL family protein N-acetyltransferase